jgi:hypothetical protein
MTVVIEWTKIRNTQLISLPGTQPKPMRLTIFRLHIVFNNHVILILSPQQTLDPDCNMSLKILLFADYVRMLTF